MSLSPERTFDLNPTPENKLEEPLVMHTQHLGAWNEVLDSMTPEQREGMRGVDTIRTLFENMRIPRTTTNGEIMRKPRLLICGGFVRDMLMGNVPKDVDFATDATYDQVRTAIDEQLGDMLTAGTVVLKETGNPEESYRVLRIIFPGTDDVTREEYEVATFRVDGESTDGRHPDSTDVTTYAGVDAQRRDLTINGLYYNTASGNIIDYVGGLDDIREQRLRFVGNAAERIREDRLRMLRYVRFLLRTGFPMDDDALQAIRTYAPTLNGWSPKIEETPDETEESAPRIKALPAERILPELEKIITLSPARALETLEKSRILREILPEVAALRECPQGPPHHMEGDVLKHTQMVCEGLPDGASLELCLAAILHDIGKKDTRQEVEKTIIDPTTGESRTEQKVSFINHEKKGVEMFSTTAERLKFKSETTKKVAWLIEQHIRVFTLPQMREENAKELVGHPYIDDLITLACADTRASLSNNPQVDREAEVQTLLAKVGEIKAILAEERAFFAAYEDMCRWPAIQERYTFTPKNGRFIGEILTRLKRDILKQRPAPDSPELATLTDTIIRNVCGQHKVTFERRQ